MTWKALVTHGCVTGHRVTQDGAESLSRSLNSSSQGWLQALPPHLTSGQP